MYGKDKSIYKYKHGHIHIYIENMFAIVGLLNRNWGEEGEDKRIIVNSIEVHCICEGKWYKEMHQKLLNEREHGIKAKESNKYTAYSQLQ
jgi:hypothetical protein